MRISDWSSDVCSSDLPEMTTAAYRMGDSYTNIMTPLMSYFPLVLVFCQRWDKSIGVGSLLALMLPYALCFMATGIMMVIAWVAFDLPLGPHAGVFYQVAAHADRKSTRLNSSH